MKRKIYLGICMIVIVVAIISLSIDILNDSENITNNNSLPNIKPSRSPLLSLIGKIGDTFTTPEENASLNERNLQAGDVLRKQRDAFGNDTNTSEELPSYMDYYSDGDKMYLKRIPVDTYLSDVNSHVPPGLTSQEWPLLKTYTINTGYDTTEVRQYLRFRESLDSNTIQSGKIKYTENENDESGDYFVLNEFDDLFEYEMKFLEGFRSRIENVSGIQVLKDFKDVNLSILGRTYDIFNAKIVGNSMQFDLLGGFKEYGKFLLEEGEEKNVELEFKNHTIKIDFVGSNDRVIISFDDEKSKNLGVGDTYTFKDGYIVGFSSVIQNEAEEVGVGDLVEVIIAHEKTGRKTITDDDFTDNNYFNYSLKVNGKNIEGAKFRVEGHLESEGKVFVMDSLKYRLYGRAPGGVVYVGSGHRLSESLREPEAMLFEIYFGGMTGTDSVYDRSDSGSNDSTSQLDNLFDLYSVDASEYRLSFKNKDNEIFDFVLYNDLGQYADDDGNYFYFNESRNSTDFIVDEDELFVLTDRNDRIGYSAIYKFEEYGANLNELTFSKMSDLSVIHVPLIATTAPTCGDVNLDGLVNSVDSSYVSNYSVGSQSFPAALNIICADVDHSGSVTVTDSLRIDQWIAGTYTLSCLDPCQNINSSFRTILSGYLNSAGKQYSMRVNNGSTDIKLAVDLNGDGLFDDSEVEAVVHTGARINFTQSSPIKLIRQSDQFLTLRNNNSIVNISILNDTTGMYISVPSSSEISMIEASQTEITIGGTSFSVSVGDRIGQSAYGDFVYEYDRKRKPNDVSVLQFVSSSSSDNSTTGERTMQSAGEIVLG